MYFQGVNVFFGLREFPALSLSQFGFFLLAEALRFDFLQHIVTREVVSLDQAAVSVLAVEEALLLKGLKVKNLNAALGVRLLSGHSDQAV